MSKSNFIEVALEEAVRFSNGKSIKPGGTGTYPVYGANGIIGGSNRANHCNAIIIGRVGAYCGSIEYCETHFWASDNTIVAYAQDGFDIKYLYYLLAIDLPRVVRQIPLPRPRTGADGRFRIGADSRRLAV